MIKNDLTSRFLWYTIMHVSTNDVYTFIKLMNSIYGHVF